MIRLEVIELATPTDDALTALRSYAAVSNPGENPSLMGLLKRAFEMVQRSADIALLEGRYRILCDDHPGIVRAYMGGKVERVTDSHGMPIGYEQRGRNIYLGTDDYAEVRIRITPNPADYERLFPVVLRYATALYDGKTGRELNQILNEC